MRRLVRRQAESGALSRKYEDVGIEPEKLGGFAKAVGSTNEAGPSEASDPLWPSGKGYIAGFRKVVREV